VSEIGRQLFGRDKSPVAILAGLAAGEDCVLVIDQLNAVSVVSGRHPEIFDAVASMVREARAHAAMRVLLVCRSFDLENDSRLGDLRQREKTSSPGKSQEQEQDGASGFTSPGSRLHAFINNRGSEPATHRLLYFIGCHASR
jgi:hypothetical protein